MGNYISKYLVAPQRKDVIINKLIKINLYSDLIKIIVKYDHLLKGKLETTIKGPEISYNINNIYWFKNNIQFIVINDKIMNIINTETQENKQLIGHSYSINSIIILEDRIVSNDSSCIIIWNPDTATLTNKIIVDKYYPLKTIHKFNNCIACYFNQEIQLLNLADYTLQKIIKISTSLINTLVTSNKKIAYSFSNIIEIWENSTIQLNGHTQNITAICFVSDNKIMSGSHDKTLRLWNMLTQECEHIFTEHQNTIYSILYPYDNYVLSTDVKGKMIIWNLQKLETTYILENSWIPHKTSIDQNWYLVNTYLHKSGNIICWSRGEKFISILEPTTDYNIYMNKQIENSLCILNLDIGRIEKTLICNQSIRCVGINSEGKIAVIINDKIEIYN